MFCFIVRKKISDSYGPGRALSEPVEKHVQECADCRTFMQQNEVLQKTLASADRSEKELPPFLHRRVMHALESETQPATIRLSKRIAVAAGAVVVAGLFALQALHLDQDSSTATAEDDWGSLQPLETGVVQAEKIISGNPDVLVQPLSTELQLLEEDLMAVAEKLDSYLNGAVLAMISPENEY